MTRDSQQQQLAEAMEVISALKEDLAATHQGFLALTLELEQRVENRTSELRASNSRLQAEIAERKRAEVALLHSQEQLAGANENLERIVTERTARLQDTIAELEHFSYTITHDMRAPLRGVRGFAQILGEEGCELTPDHCTFVNKISNAAERMDALIADALSFSRFARDGFPLESIDAETLLRETFNLWTPTYFSAFVGLTNAESASRSALFPLFGGVSVLLAGFLSDRLGLNGRSLVLFGGLLSGAAAICLLAQVPSHSSPWIPVTIVALIGFLLMGPYSYLAGAMSMDFGGETGSATAAGIIDGVGYLAGVLSGDTMARFTVLYGWRSSFVALGVTCLGTALVALVLAIQQRRQAQIRLAAGRAA